MTIKVLHISTSNQWGGIQQRIFILSKMLNIREIKTFIALPPGGYFTEKLKEVGIETIPFELNSRWDIRNIFSLRKILLEKKIDILHVHRSKEHFVGFLAAKCFSPLKIKLVRTKHEDFPISKNILNHILYARFTDKIITVAEKIKKDAVNNNHFKPSHIVTIHSAVMMDRFNPEFVDGKKIRKSLSIPEDIPLIGTIGKIHYRKGYITFLKACKIIKDYYPNAKFVWVGKGPEEEKAKNFAYKIGLQDSVVFMGKRTDTPEIMAALDIFVLASKIGEGSPAVIKEALLMHKPVVSTNIGGIPEIIKDEQMGILVPPEKPNELAEAILKILRNPNKKELQTKGRNFIKENFSELTLMEKTKKVYLDLLK